METRFNMEETRPDAYKAVYSLAMQLNKTSLTLIQKQLIKIRASQLNSCAFCLDMHTKEALKGGESQQRIFVLSAWRETDLFSAAEKALLALAEEVTLIHAHGVSDAVYREAEKHFGPEGVADIILSTAMINVWNRIAVSTHTQIPK